MKRGVWLASYPRSGNTLLRTILWHCFGLRSGSYYLQDLGGVKALEEYVGHVEFGPEKLEWLRTASIPLMKTHEPPSDDRYTIYIVRDGRAVCVSLWEFFGRKIPLEQVIAGEHYFGTWSSHVLRWRPWDRRGTLLLRYEDLRSDLDPVLGRLQQYLRVDPVRDKIPARSSIAGVGGRWVRMESDWRSVMNSAQLALFDQINGEVLQMLSYLGM